MAEELKRLPQGQIVRIISDAEPRAFTLFLGAGASRSSGVPSGGDLVKTWRETAYRESEATEELESWCKRQEWYAQPDEYSRLFELICVDVWARQRELEKLIKDAFPGWGYLYLASLMTQGYFNVCFTTNFDDLIHDALKLYLDYRPVVCAAGSEVKSINFRSPRAKIIKLHGDFLYTRLKNTVNELRELDPNMDGKLRDLAGQFGMVVLGYGGRDHSVMRVFEDLLKRDPYAFERGIFWGLHPDETPSALVTSLAKVAPDRFRLFQCRDFDLFMAQTHAALEKNGEIKFPETILHPHKGLKMKFEHLEQSINPALQADPAFQEHLRKLQTELNLPWANPESTAQLDLLQAELHLGRRDHKAAIESVTRYLAKKPGEPMGLGVWGGALYGRAEEEGSEQGFEEAAEKWKAAIQADPEFLPARYALARYYQSRNRFREALTECEALLPLAPTDPYLREQMAQVYYLNGRLRQSWEQLEWLVARDPRNPRYRLMRGQVLETRGKIVEAVEELRLAAEMDPANPWFRFNLGGDLIRLGFWDEGVQEMEQAVRLAPENVAFRTQIANAYLMRNRFPAAILHLEAAVAADPESTEARGLLGQTYGGMGRFDEARRELEHIVRISPRDGRAHLTVGNVYMQSGYLDLAEWHLREAIRLNPANPQPYFSLALLLRNSNRMQDAAALLEELRRFDLQAAQFLWMQLQGGVPGPGMPPIGVPPIMLPPAQNAPGSQPMEWLKSVIAKINS
jgi:tetratricopeptide (TPR) repeat protein